MTPKRARLLSWNGPLPERGDVLETDAGSVYLILNVRGNYQADRKSVAALQLGKLDPDEIAELPADVVRHRFAWASRAPQRHPTAEHVQ